MRHIVTYFNHGDSDYRKAELYFSAKRSVYIITSYDSKGSYAGDTAYGFSGDANEQTAAFDAAVFFARKQAFG